MICKVSILFVNVVLARLCHPHILWVTWKVPLSPRTQIKHYQILPKKIHFPPCDVFLGESGIWLEPDGVHSTYLQPGFALTCIYIFLGQVGGLGDVVAGLAHACLDRGHNVEVMLPFYESMSESDIEGLQHDRDFECPKVRLGNLMEQDLGNF